MGFCGGTPDPPWKERWGLLVRFAGAGPGCSMSPPHTHVNMLNKDTLGSAAWLGAACDG